MFSLGHHIWGILLQIHKYLKNMSSEPLPALNHIWNKMLNLYGIVFGTKHS